MKSSTKGVSYDTALMEAGTITRVVDGARQTDIDPIAEELKNAHTREERARILAPCVAEVIDQQGLTAEVAYPPQEERFDTGIHTIVSDRG